MLSAKRQIRVGGDARSFGLRLLPSLLLATMLVGCDDDVVDRTPPAIPSGVYSITADQQVILRWIPNREPDLAGYSVLWNDDGGAEYFIIATFDALDPDHFVIVDQQDPSQDYVEFVDRGDDGLGLANGTENYYAVLAFDFEGNESDLSLELIRDVPRPEGQVVLESQDFDPQQSGFDFSDQRIVPFDSANADVWLTISGGVAYFDVAGGRVRLQDYGNVGFDVLSEAPIGGWSIANRAEVILGHTYAFEIAAGNGVNYAKFTVVDLSINGRFADLDWGYQPVVDEWQLKGPGASSSPRRSYPVRVRRTANQ